MAAAKLLTNMPSSMNSLGPWGWTNPIFSRDIHGSAASMSRSSVCPSFTSYLLCQAILRQCPGKSWSKAWFLCCLLSQHLRNLLQGWLLFPAWRSGQWARPGKQTATEAHGKFLSPYALFCFVFPFFLSFYSFISCHQITCVKKFFARPSSSLWLLEQELAAGRGLAGNNKSTFLITLNVA